MSKSVRKYFALVLILSLIIPLSVFIKKAGAKNVKKVYGPTTNETAYQRAERNYSKDIKQASKEFDVPYEYLMALTMLECGGHNPSGNRFEKHVYEKLKKVKSGKRLKYENIRKKTIEDATDKALRNLATSWGPFQLMGYKCVGLDVNVMDIRGERSTYYGVKWINEEYGDLLRKGKYRDAFHMHNTGRKIPSSGKVRTHDPTYVDRGMKYLKYFEKR